MSRLRHWKQRWDPNAPLKFMKRLRMGDDPKKPYVNPGELVTDEQRQKLGVNRLRRWWDSGVLERADFDPTVRGGVSEDAPKSTPSVPRKTVAVHIEKGEGRGNYLVNVGDDEPIKVRGKKKAENLANELRLGRVNGPKLQQELEPDLSDD